jgi:hypothetical protein
MYYPEIDVDIRLNAPKAHQRIISKLTASLGHLFYHEHEISLEPLPETQIDEGQASPVPDILLYDNETYKTPIIIEVCHPNGLNNDMKKIIRLIEENDYGIEEGFIYDYVRGMWSKYIKGVGQVFDNQSYSDILDMDLAGLL